MMEGKKREQNMKKVKIKEAGRRVKEID